MSIDKLSPQSLAENVMKEMLVNDCATRGLDMHVESIGPGQAKIMMQVRSDMLNGFNICHGGFIATLADSAFAYACNSRNQLTVASGISINFVSSAKEGDCLIAEAKEISLSGRTGIYDVNVLNQDSILIAVMRGNSYRLRDRYVIAV